MAKTTVDSPRPRSTFPDGRMAPKDAWNYCRAICGTRDLPAPTLSDFKWHLRNSPQLAAKRAPNPFGGDPKTVWAVRPDGVVAFVEGLADGSVAPRKKEGASKKNSWTTPPAPSPSLPDCGPPQSDDDLEMPTARAFEYLRAGATKRSTLNSTTFRLYLAYDLIPSRKDGKQRKVRRGDLDAFLELAPDGVYANHISYRTAERLTGDQMSLKDAYVYYADVDPNAVTLNTFRSIVAAGILQAVRMADDPRSPVVGLDKREVDAFLALRHRMLEASRQGAARETFLARKEKEAGDSEVGRIVQAVVEKATPQLEAARQRAEEQARRKKHSAERKKKKGAPRKKKVSKKEGRWVPIKEAYAHYRERSPKPLTESWFRNKCYTTDLFGKQLLKDERPNNPTGKRYLIDLDTVDAYLTGTSPPKRRQQSWTVKKAHAKLRQTIPAHLTLTQFEYLVEEGLIESFQKRGSVYVSSDAVEEYFAGCVELDPEQELQTGAAYAYYCSRCGDPVAKAHFARWVTGGEIDGAQKNGDGLWTATVAAIDDFLAKFPSGRMRRNRNSRVALGSGKEKRRLRLEKKAKTAKTEEPAVGKVSVSIKSYPSAAEMRKAVALLTSQGFEVEVKP